MSAPLVFLDIETTGLDPEAHEVWEVGIVVRTVEQKEKVTIRTDQDYHWFLSPQHLETATPEALAIGGYYERHPYGDNFAADGLVQLQKIAAPYDFARDFERLTRGATLVGANVRFDERFLNDYLRKYHRVPGWHFRLCDVEAMTQGYMGLAKPTGLAKCANLLEIPNEYLAHTALDDAKLARDIYDAVVNDRFGRRK
jgi:DNA polymerase III epsilon subunit-like protein